MNILYAIIGIPLGLLFFAALEKGGDAFFGTVRPSSRPRPAPMPRQHTGKPGGRGYYCIGHGYGTEGAHFHLDGDDADRCMAGMPPIVPADKRPAACPRCNRNHFEEKCPGYRVTDGRTGEVVGYWQP